ncbi:hypothetical protein DFH09DRAFT_1102817 [Mycena vulgaris]|nr:hypothetical protein DFH09DRAFT_1102817 [Mycena vulgaris]
MSSGALSSCLPTRTVSRTHQHVLWSINKPQPPVLSTPRPTRSGVVSGNHSFSLDNALDRPDFSPFHPPRRPNSAVSTGDTDDRESSPTLPTVDNSMAETDNREDSPPRNSSSPEPAPKKRCVVDLDPDDDDWEDEDTQLEGLGTTTHRSRNRARPVIPVRKHRRVVRGANSRATAEARRKSLGNRDFAADLAAWEVEREERAQQLAEKHSMKVQEVRRRMLSTSAFKPKRKASLYNAKISRIMADINEGLPVGKHFKMAEVKARVAADPTLLDAFTKEEEAEMLEEVMEKRKRKFRGARANNLAAGADAKRTVERMMVEITGLAERAGMIGFAMFTRGHIHDKTVPVTIQSWGALDFFREILKKDPADVAALFELWAVSRERGDTGADTLIGMQKDCTAMIIAGLKLILNRTSVKMNFENYIKRFVEGKNVGLVGWPEGVEFKRMSKQSAVGPLRILRDALKCGTVRWKVLTAGEKQRLLEQFKDMVEKGEVREKVGKTRAKASSRTSRAKKTKVSQESDDDNDGHPPKAKAKPTRTSTRTTQQKSKKRAMASEDEGEEDDANDDPPAKSGRTLRAKQKTQGDPSEDDDAPRKAIGDMTVQEKRAYLLRLVGRRRKAGREGDKCGAAKSSKRAREEESDRPRKKVKANADKGEGGASGKGSKRKRGGEEEDEGAQKKKKKKKASEEVPVRANPAPPQPRPKPRPKAPAGKSRPTPTTMEGTLTTGGAPGTGSTTGTPPAISTTNASADTPATSTMPAISTSTATPTADAPTSATTTAEATADASSNTAKGAAGVPLGEVTNGAPIGGTSAGGTPAPNGGKRNTVKGKAGGPPGIR